MMHHRCSGSCHGTMVGGRCSSGLFYGGDHHHRSTTTKNSNSFSMLFSMPNCNAGNYATHHHPNYLVDESSDNSVDCTLTLGTPSTRLSNIKDTTNNITYNFKFNHDDDHDHDQKINYMSSKVCSNSRSVSNFCWDILQSKHSPSSQKSSRGSCYKINSGTESTLLSRRCANCDTTSTPLWRNGPKGPKSLCNACGIRFKKEEKRASAASVGGCDGVPAVEAVDDGAQHSSSWIHQYYHSSPSQNNQKQSHNIISSKHGIINHEFKFFDDDRHREYSSSSADTPGIPPYLSSWRLDVTDRPAAGLVHEFTI